MRDPSAVSRPKKVLVIALAAPVALVVVWLAAWGIDTWLHRDSVARNVELAGEPVGGMSRRELRGVVAQLAERLPGTEVVIDTEDFEVSADAGDLGLGIDEDGTVDSVWETQRDEPLVVQPVTWLRSLFSTTDADAKVRVDAEQLSGALAMLEGGRRTEPVEPALAADEQGVTLVPGTDGAKLTVNAVVSALPRSLADVGEPIRIEVERTVTPPRIEDAAVQALVDQANGVTAEEITLTAGDRTFTIAGKDFRPAFAVTDTDGAPRLTMNPEAVGKLLAKNLPAGSGNPTDVRFDIQGGRPVPVPGHDAQVCCAENAPDVIVQGLLEGKTSIELPTRTMTAAEGVQWAGTLGVKEVIGQFTTNHPAGQPRVKNIHTIADATRGVLIAPGDTFSVNGYVGRRTPEKGYVSAPAIENGEYVQDVGGGVSQYATTLFNAAFFGGLDIPAYKAHSKYISRYPFGREATLAYPSVDLKVRNDTPYGVVIWPTYTDSSITVQLWSTRHAAGTQTAQSKSSGCGRVTTERTRLYVDGHTEKDSFSANYDCE